LLQIQGGKGEAYFYTVNLRNYLSDEPILNPKKLSPDISRVRGVHL
jgi:hypothetical protein